MSSEIKAPVVLEVSVVCGAILLIIEIFKWTLVEWLTPFIFPLLELATFAIFLAIIVWSLVYFVRHRKRVGIKKAIAPLGLNIVVLSIALFFPFTEITTKLDFGWNYQKRMAVASAVLNGQMDRYITQKGGRGDFIHLPPTFEGLSSGGDDIMVFRRDGHVFIFFFTYRGILDHFSGFVYSSDDAKPENGDFGGEFFELERLRPHWYWAASR